MDLHAMVTSQACLDSYFAMSIVARVEVDLFTLHSCEVYFKITFL